jgi:predicted RNA binding protein YcfA (HicA-like mRNA interferase family)
VKRDLHALVRQAESEGWLVERTNGGHLRLTHPNGAVVFCAWSPSDSRAVKNVRALLRRKAQEGRSTPL